MEASVSMEASGMPYNISPYFQFPGMFHDGLVGSHQMNHQAFYFQAARVDHADAGQYHPHLLAVQENMLAPGMNNPSIMPRYNADGGVLYAQVQEMKLSNIEDGKVKQEVEQGNDGDAAPGPSAWPPNYWPGNSGMATSNIQASPAVPSCSNRTYPTTSGGQSPQPATNATGRKTPRKRSHSATSTSCSEASPPNNAVVPLSPAPPAPAPPKQSRRQQNGQQNEVTDAELDAFVKLVKQKRVSRGFTQHDVGSTLGHLQGQTFSQTTVCRFESKQLSFRNMCELMPLFKRWLDAIETNCQKISELLSQEQSTAPTRSRRRRTNIQNDRREMLESYYADNVKPNLKEMEVISQELDLTREVIRVWFCNRRQRDRRRYSHRENATEDDEAPFAEFQPHGPYHVPQEMQAQFYLQPPTAPVPAAFSHLQAQRGNSPIVRGDEVYSQGGPILHRGDVYPQAMPHGGPLVHRGLDVYPQVAPHDRPIGN